MSTPGKDRSGTEPVRARSAVNLRILLSVIFAPIFLIAAGLLAWWAAGAGPDGRAALSLIAGVCALLFVIATADAAVLRHRTHH